MLLFEPTEIGLRIETCLILHNMGVSDRVMDGQVRTMYDPKHSLERTDEYEIIATHILQNSLDIILPLMNQYPDNFDMKKQWNDLVDPQEHLRLYTALLNNPPYHHE